MRCTRFSRYVGKFNCCDYFITEKSEKLFDAITEMDKFAERRKPRKPRSSKNRKPYGTSKALEQILNGEKTQNDIISELGVKEPKENA